VGTPLVESVRAVMTKSFYDHLDACRVCLKEPGRLCVEGKRLHEETVKALTDRLAPEPLRPAKA
jgi:hypothetical protein